MEVTSKYLLLSTLFSVALTGCGGGGSSVSPTSTNNDTGSGTDTISTLITGAVADGYLYGATVCLDLNDNKRCDGNESTTTSGDGGKYTLSGVSAADKNAYSIVVEVDTSVVDEDTGQTVTKPYVLTTPPGKPGFVSPLSTLVHTTMDKLKLTVDDAERLVKQNIAFDEANISLFKDYVAASGDASYNELHKIAQIVAHLLGESRLSINEAIDGSGIDSDVMSSEIQNLLVQQVFEQLADIKRIASEKSEDSPFTESELSGLVMSVSADNIRSTLERELIEQRGSTDFDMQTLLTNGGGLHRIHKSDYNEDCSGDDSCSPDFRYEKSLFAVKPAEGNSFLLDYKASDWQDGQWSSESGVDSDAVRIFRNSGWVYDAGNEFSFKGNISLLGSEIGVSFLEVNVAGQKMLPYLTGPANQSIDSSLSDEMIDPNALFTAEAKAYLASTRTVSDIYSVSIENDIDYGSCYNEIDRNDETTNCNSVSAEEGGLLQSLGDLFATDLDEEKKIYSSSLYAAQYVKVNRQSVDDQQGIAKIRLSLEDGGSIVTTWKYKELAPGIKVLSVAIPKALADSDDWYYDRQTELFFAEIDGYVRFGEFTPKGTVSRWYGYQFNSNAMNDILEQFNP